jgi:hypothetical protein
MKFQNFQNYKIIMRDVQTVEDERTISGHDPKQNVDRRIMKKKRKTNDTTNILF